MKYFLIAGEASGDLHGSHLIAAILERDPEATFRFIGGDLMANAASHASNGSVHVTHYRDLAYMGFIQVALHARTILRGISMCKKAIAEWRPDALILIDYPGFNLKIAKSVKAEGICPVFYYIAPKIWAWKEWRIKAIRRDVDRLFSILPFEVDFFEGKHHYPITYVGNPSYDEVTAFLASHPTEETPSRRIIALLPGSRTAEIKDNLPTMLRACEELIGDYDVVIAGAPSQPAEIYADITKNHPNARVTFDGTFALLQKAHCAIVTSGTATLETAIFRVPQVVCYNMRGGRLTNLLKRILIRVPFVSLPNLICQCEVVPELIAADMTVANVRRHLLSLLEGEAREAQLKHYDDLLCRLATHGAPETTAECIVNELNKNGKDA